MGRPVAGMRLDYMKRIVDAIAVDKELESVLGAPVDRHVVLLVEGGRFKFNALTPVGEEVKDYTSEQKARAAQIVQNIIKMNYPGNAGLPEVK